MEAILECFFENFSQLERNALHARYKRCAMVEYLNTLIEGCCRGEECDPQKTCREAVISILRYHENCMKSNGSVCMMGKCHNILYVAVKLCYLWQLKDTPTVAALLEQIYCCEKTFERLWVGALFGIRAPYFFTGWKSDFEDQEENLRAVVYFLDHATDAGLEFPNENGELVRFVDVPIESCGKGTPLKIVTELGHSDKLHILLRFGAKCDQTTLDNLLNNLNSEERMYPYSLIGCLQFFSRALPSISLQTEQDCLKTANEQINVISDKFPHLIEDGIVPTTRCGLQPPELKHICRCCIRHQLWQNYQLPNGIRTLPIPESLQKYLDLLMD